MRKRRTYGQGTLPKDKCEICSYSQAAALNVHHIIPRRDPRCTNDNGNLAILCHSCHDLVHAGELTIIGVYSTSAGRKLMWFRFGETPPLEEEYWVVRDNPYVITNRKSLVQDT